MNFYVKAFESYRLTNIHTYIRTYIHTYIETDRRRRNYIPRRFAGGQKVDRSVEYILLQHESVYLYTYLLTY